MVFKEGDELQSICFEDDGIIRVGADCDKIIVVMEKGQMSEVPWFEVWNVGKLISKWNAARCEGVTYAK